jgi:dCTP deaminase
MYIQRPATATADSACRVLRVGFCGTWTLEITVTYPTRVYAGVEICQLQFTSVYGEIGKIYQGKYAGQIAATASGIHQELKK